MKHIILLVIAFFISSTAIGQTFFEGEITYSVTVDLYQENHPWNDYLKKKWGHTMVVSHDKSGSYKKEYKGSEPTGFEWAIQNQKNSFSYTKYHFMDTVLYYDTSESFWNLISLKDGNSKKINGKDYPSVILKASNPENDKKIVEIHYYYDPKLRLDPRNYAKLKDGSLDKVYEKTRSHLIQWSIEEKGLYKATFTAVKTETKKIDLAIIRFDKSLPLKKI